MRTVNRRSLPASGFLPLSGKYYCLDIGATSDRMQRRFEPVRGKHVLVKVLSRNLERAGKEYQPTEFIFTVQTAPTP